MAGTDEALVDCRHCRWLDQTDRPSGKEREHTDFLIAPSFRLDLPLV